MTPFESMSPVEHGWFLGQIDEALASDYDEDLYKALWSVFENGDVNILYLDDRMRRAVVKFIDMYVNYTIEEAGKLGLEQTPASIAHIAGVMCCLAGIAVGMNYEEEGEEE